MLNKKVMLMAILTLGGMSTKLKEDSYIESSLDKTPWGFVNNIKLWTGYGSSDSPGVSVPV